MGSPFRVDIKIKERCSNHLETVDSHNNISPEQAIFILDSKYVTKSKKLSKLAKAIDETVVVVAGDIEKFTGLKIGKR